jgi:hypothetical protein
MTAFIEANVNTLLLSVRNHDAHLEALETSNALHDEMIKLQSERIDTLSKHITLLHERLDVSNAAIETQSDQILKLVNLVSRLALHNSNVQVQNILKEQHND